MGRKAKIFKPWEDVFEDHPWQRFPKVNNGATSLIVGSFPPNKFTTHREELTSCDTNFFYGSRDNEFWELFIESLNLKFEWPDHIKKLKKWIKENKWMVTDIVMRAKRRQDSAFDNDLIEIVWNTKTINSILKSNPIAHIYFTSRWVEAKFKANILCDLKIKKQMNETILISPSRNGLRSIKRAKYLKIKKRKKETPREFRLRYYKATLFHKT